MHPLNELTDAAAEMAVLIGAVEPDQLGAATPCPDYDVRALINHLIAWSPFIVAAGRREPISGRPDEQADHMSGDWRGDYLGWIDRITAVWGAEATWDGTMDLGFAEVPAIVIGGKTICEFVLHGWDLAQATDQKFRCGEAVARTTGLLVAQTAEETRRLGMFGPAVPVPDSASDLDRALGASGRDPRRVG